MIKPYLDIDEHYKNSMSDFNVLDKIQYLEDVIDKNQNVLSKSGSLISKLRRLELVETIESAQKEIKNLQSVACQMFVSLFLS